jgi:hypothetical protein
LLWSIEVERIALPMRTKVCCICSARLGQRDMFEFSSQQSQMMLLAGVVLMGWILIRRQLKWRQRRVERDNYGDFANRRSQPETSAGVPLASAPQETQRWHAEMFELQRELKAELDMKIAVVQSLLRQADETIDRLGSLKQK